MSKSKPARRPDAGAQMLVTQQFRSGPLPMAEELRAYDQVVPGAAERIIRMAEEEQQHRHKQERRYGRQRFYAQIGGTLMGFGIVGLSWYMVYTGNTENLPRMLWASAAVIGAAIGARVLGHLVQRGQRSNGQEA